jgi:hypothetical protein
MTRKVPRSATFDDLLALPEGQWHEAAHGFGLTVTYRDSRGKPHRAVVPISKAMAKRLSSWEGEELSATLEGSTLVLVRQRARRRKKARRA